MSLLRTRTILIAGGALALLTAAGPSAAQAPGQGGSQSRSMFPDLTTGEAVFKNICQGCHMPDGKGATGAGAYPALANNPKLAAPAYPAMVVVRGQKAMPEFGTALTDEQIAGVVTYIRSNFGNSFNEPVAASDVAAFRPEK